tara:strand:- start:2834 stop:3487 length:654 start_codon:yes stop_codon:yes gene_type:complete
MAGIEELTNIMTQGARSDVPMSMGAQPMESAQGIAGMMPPQDMAMMQQEQVPNPADSAPQGIDINSDADMLASAVVGRTNGDLDEAEQVLEQSLMLIKTAKSRTQQPTMAAYGKPIMAAEGKPIPDGKEGAGLRALPKEVVEKMGFVKAADGRAMMRSMIMNSLSKKPEEKKMAYGGEMKEMSYGGDVKKMMGGGPMKYADGGEMEEYAGGGLIYLP